MEDEIEDMGVF